jgi:hypothetical protein
MKWPRIFLGFASTANFLPGKGSHGLNINGWRQGLIYISNIYGLEVSKFLVGVKAKHDD